MHLQKPLLSTLLLLPTLTLSTPLHQTNTTQALVPGHAIVHNNCSFPVYLWSVGSTTSPEHTLAQNARYTETFRHDPQTGGVGIKLTTEKNGLAISAAQTVFAYNLVSDQVWYDLSDVFGDPFKGHRVVLDGDVVDIIWPRGVPPVGEGRVGVQGAGRDLVLSVC
ncbi:hypothetical protein BDV23DRAFT_181263 [Aspergillus alliaceus]|uniref:Bys1 family protein n=1 Tax=Petromyces alliaceus TaxID=209559 RepID=A0A5N7CG59_PETAA|nr:hypothetical protein BDV23DRAFT_181263 [Aspergillus alliaceus]